MQRLEGFWSALESVSGQTLPIGQWEEVLRQDFEFGLRFLRSTGELADWWPCSRNSGDGCPRHVHEIRDGSFVARCGNEPKQCETISLIRQSLVLHEVRVERLAHGIAGALGLESSVEKHPHVPGVWFLGSKHSAGREQATVCLVIPDPSETLRSVVVEICSAIGGSLIIVTPTGRDHTFRTQQIVGRSGGMLLALDELLALDGDNLVAVAPLAQPPTPDSKSESARRAASVIRKRGQRWELEFDGKPVLLIAPTGPLYVVNLLMRPYESMPVTELIRMKSRHADLPGLGSAGKATDTTALRQYRRRLESIESELARAEAESNARQIRELTEDRRLLNAHLSSVTGLGGRIRIDVEALERMRKAVAGALDRTYAAIERAEHPLLAHHLRTFIYKGRELSYRPVPLVQWLQE